MKLLLDTHAFLWFIGGDERLSPTARKLIEDANNATCISVWRVCGKWLSKLVLADCNSHKTLRYSWLNNWC